MDKISNVLKRNSKKTLIFRIVFLSVMTAMFIVFTFFDFSASEALYGGDTTFGKIFSYTFFVIGYLPAIFVDAVLVACAFALVKKKGLKILFGFLSYSIMFGAAYTLFESFEDVNSVLKLSVSGALGAGGALGLVYGISRLSRENLKKLFYIFVVGAAMALIAIILVASLQYTWGRDRFFAILNGTQGAAYTPWYLPQGPASKVDFRSFPSMHSSSAASMVMLIFTVCAFNFKKPLKIALTVVSVLIMVCVPLSRVVMGWHYFTDVIFAVLLAYASLELGLLITDKLIYKNKTPLWETAAIE